MNILIFANGDPADGLAVRRVLDSYQTAHVIAADGGLYVARHYDRTVDVVIGDMDSVAPPDLDLLEDQGVQILRHPVDKDETDLELALYHAADLDARSIVILGAVGGRLDQMLANVYLLALPQLTGRDVCMVAGKQMIRLLNPGDHTLTGQVGDTLSLLPVGGDACGIRTRDLQFPLRDETLKFGPARGISNVITASEAGISLKMGRLLLIHTVGKAE